MVCVQTWGNKCEMPSCVLEDKASDDHRMVECAEVCVREGGREGGREKERARVQSLGEVRARVHGNTPATQSDWSRNRLTSSVKGTRALGHHIYGIII